MPRRHSFSINRPSGPFPSVRQDKLRGLSMRVRLLILSLLTLFLPHLTLAQATNGSVRGMVTDQNGAALSRATVAVKNAATGFERRLTTSDEGSRRGNRGTGSGEVVMGNRRTRWRCRGSSKWQ